MKKLCIFDLDGTLTETLVSISFTTNKVLRELGLPEQPIEAFRYFVGDGAAELCRRALRAAGDTDCVQFDVMYSKYMEYFKELCMYEVKPYPGIMELLEGLKRRGIAIAVLSNKPHLQTISVVEMIFGKGYFDAIQGQCADIPRKPAPDGVYLLLDRFGVTAEECLYIGDTGTDMMTGKASGAFTVGVLWGFRDEKELREYKADAIVSKAEEILTLAMGENHD